MTDLREDEGHVDQAGKSTNVVFANEPALIVEGRHDLRKDDCTALPDWSAKAPPRKSIVETYVVHAGPDRRVPGGTLEPNVLEQMKREIWLAAFLGDEDLICWQDAEKGHSTNDCGCDDWSGVPRIEDTSPIESKEEDDL